MRVRREKGRATFKESKLQVGKCWWAGSPDSGSETLMHSAGSGKRIQEQCVHLTALKTCIYVSWVQSIRKGNQPFPVKGETQSRVVGVCCEPDSLF